MLWRCPRCRGELNATRDGVQCQGCAARYERVGDILDLRVHGNTWIEYNADKAEARRLIAETSGWAIDDLARRIFRSQSGGARDRIEVRTRQVMEAPHRLRKEIKGWLGPSMGDGLFLDLGCGPGMLLAAAFAEGRKGVGIDVSLVWLVFAQRLIVQWGGKANLAAANADALPLADNSVSAVVSLDVIEHVADTGSFLREINRVTVFGGTIALSTPNRYSLAAEPHVSVWGVGWLPYAWQKKYVKWRSGKEYEFTRLLSARQITRLMRLHTSFRFQIQIPRVPEEEIARFKRYRAVLAMMYNRLVLFSGMRAVFRMIGPFFRIVGTKT